MRTSPAGQRTHPMRQGARVAALATLTVVLVRILWWSVQPPLREVQRQLFVGAGPSGGWTLDRLVVDAAAIGLIITMSLLLGLVALTIAAACCASVSPRLDALAARVTPSVVRRAALTLGGLALTGPGLTAAAHADDSGSTGSPDSDRRPAVAGLPLPDLPSAHREMVTVSSGDSLWSIARRGLPPNAPDTAVATRAALLYADNRQIIGANPNLIFPGQQLIAPGGAA